jgi:UDPglucose 6-dehydrogenase
MLIGIIGNGYVGGATALLGEHAGIECLVYDKEPARSVPINLSLEELKPCDLIFICVPTPMFPDGRCCTEAVKEVVHNLKHLSISPDKIVVRSTVPVGTCDSLGVNFMPEFLTEAEWQEDFRRNKDWIIGMDFESEFDSPELWKKRSPFSELAGIANKNIFYIGTREAELVKLTRNAFLAVKVSFFNEVELFCSENDLNFETVRLGITKDKRIGRSHSKVPGPDGKRGFGGTCFPKDLNSLIFQMYEGYRKTPSLLRTALHRNDNIDRKDKDWQNNKGRAVV